MTTKPGYTIAKLEDAADVLGDYPGEMRMFKEPLGTEQVALTYRRMPAQTGGKGGYGHSHKTQEEVLFVISGRLQVKLDDDVVEVGKGTAVRFAPSTVRSVWNEGPDDAELVLVSTRLPGDAHDDIVIHQDFWPA